MFERFTDRARRVIVLAQEEARALQHNYIGTEHLLLGLIREGEGVAAKALASKGVELDATRKQVEEMIGKGNAAPNGHIPFTPHAKQVLEFSLREALQLGHSYIGTEHILLGLIKEKDGLAAQALDRLNVSYDGVVQAIRQVVTIDEDTDVSGHLSFTPRVKRVLENSLREAMQMGQSYISTEHLLLGIVQMGVFG